MNGQLAGFIAGNASDHIFQRMIGSQLIASPGNGCNLERRNSAVRFLINLRVIKVVPEPLTLHIIIRLLARRNVCFDDEVTSFQVEIQDFHCKLLSFQVQPVQLIV